MNDALDTVLKVVAGAASAAALLAAVAQLTLRQRMRRTAEWARQSGNFEASSRRKAALRDVEVWATGHVLASTHIPLRMYVGGLFWSVSAPLLIFISAAAGAGPWVMAFMVIISFITVTTSLRRTVLVHLERLRITQEYFKDETIVPVSLPVRHGMEGGTRTEYAYASMLSGGICLVSLGAANFTLIHGRVVELSDSIFVILGLALFFMPIRWMHSKAPSSIHAGWSGRSTDAS